MYLPQGKSQAAVANFNNVFFPPIISSHKYITFPLLGHNIIRFHFVFCGLFVQSQPIVSPKRTSVSEIKFR